MNNCYKTSNNKYFDCPARMSDARHFTDYKANCELIAQIKMDNKLHNSFETRLFLQNNATKLMGINQKHSCQLNCCNLREDFSDTMAPPSHKVECNSKCCNRTLINPYGVGDYINYNGESDNCNNLPKQWPVSNQENNICQVPQHNYALVNDTRVDQLLQRNTMPRGDNRNPN